MVVVRVPPLMTAKVKRDPFLIFEVMMQADMVTTDSPD